MAVVPKRYKKVDVKAVELGRAAGKSYELIARELDVSSSAVWRAVNRRERKEVFPSGRQRGIYMTDERWESVRAMAGVDGLNYSQFLAVLVDRERGRRSA